MTRPFALSLVALGMMTLGMVGQAGAAVVERETLIGRQVFVFFSASKTVTCGGVAKTATISGDVVGSESISRSTGMPFTRSNVVTPDVFFYSNECTGVSFGFGGGLPASGLVGPGPLLNLAIMNASSTVQDFGSGVTLPVTTHLTVTSSGPLTSSGSTTETHTVSGPGGPFTLTITRSANSSRPGTVTGTFTINGDVFDLTGTSADLSGNSNSTLTVSKP
jgi:hypothetical protein